MNDILKCITRSKSVGRLPEQSSSYLIKAMSKEGAKEKFLKLAGQEYRSICKITITRILEEN